MPAAAVIPAPIAYIKVVAVKKLVVELLIVWRRSTNPNSHPSKLRDVLNWTTLHFDSLL